MDTVTGTSADSEFVGYGPAAEHLGISADTLSGYVSRGVGPDIMERRANGQYVRPVFKRSVLDEWNAARPGRGARTDRMHSGKGQPCGMCGERCEIGD